MTAREEKKMGNIGDTYHDDDIVVVGMALSTSAGDSLEEFWESIKNSEDCIYGVRGTRKEDLISYYNRKNHSLDLGFFEGGLLKEIDLFDNEFFHMKELDALCASPCMRYHLQVMWHALEDAGYKEKDLSNEKVDVYTGIVTDAQIYEYREVIKEYRKSLLPVAMYGHLLPMIPGTLAYYLNLKGVTAVVDTTCSSSSTALIQAAGALKDDRCKAAVVAGGRFIYNPEHDIDEFIGIESDDMRTRAFDESANGTASGEGVAAIVIKKYSQALKDNDRIYGVIKGYAANQSGKTLRMGVPNYESQMNVIEQGIKNAGLSSEDIQYCEAHGTGTYVGDYLEILSIDKAFRKDTEKIGFCGVGSVKSNLGHTYGASGVISIIKCMLAMNKGYIPPTTHFSNPNKKINFINSPLYVNSKLKKWEAETKRCMVNCFGISGANCNIVMEEYKKEEKQTEEKKGKYFVAITAKSENSLKMMLPSYEQYLEQTEDSLANISYSTMVRRNHFKHKLLFFVENREELLHAVREVIAGMTEGSMEDAVDQKTSFYSNRVVKKKVDHQDLLQRYCKGKDECALRELGDCYLQGQEIAWESLYGDGYTYVSLPAYVFDQHRIWINEESLRAIDEKQNEGKKKVKSIEVTSSGEVTAVEKELGQIFCEFMQIEKVDVDDNLFGFGLNSIQGMKLLNRVHEKYGVELSVVNLFEFDTIRKLAASMSESKKTTGFQLFRAQVKDSYDLSSAQKRIYLQDMIQKNNEKTLLQGAYVMNGKIDVEKLEKAIHKIIENNEVLHTALVDMDGIPQQVVKKDWQFVVETGKQSASIDEEMRIFVSKFDLTKPPFMRIKVLEMEEGQDAFLFCAHHSVFDGTSILLFLDELNAYYSGNTFEQKEYNYIDYSESMKEYVKTEIYQKQRAYWEEQYADGLVVSNLPKTYDIAESAKDASGRKYYFSFSKEFTARLTDFAKNKGITVFMEIYASLVILLHKYSEDSDICVGIPYAGRNHVLVEKMLGVFINTLAIRTQICGEEAVSQVIDAVKEQCIHAFQNAEYGYEELTQKVGGEPFQVMFIYQNMGERNLFLHNLVGEEYPLHEVEAKYDMTIEMFPVNDQIEGNVEYNASLMSEEYVAELITHLENVLSCIMENDARSVKEISLLNGEQTEELLALGKGKEEEITKNVIDLWYEALEMKNPVAIKFHDQQISYQKLENLSNQIAMYIEKHMYGEEKTIPVLMHRNEKLIAALLGILKAGYSYIPLDPEYPQSRIDYIVKNSRVRTILTEHACQYENDDIEKLYIEDLLQAQSEAGEVKETGKINHADFAETSYTIYTSGTSGNPKGVSVRHREMANFVQAIQHIEPFAVSDRILCVTTICFDIFVLECFCTLCHGATMVLADETECVDVERLAELIQKHSVDIIQFTPSRMQIILSVAAGRAAMKQLKTIFLGGESLNLEILNQLRQYTDARIINMYGPTETTVWSTYKDVTKDDYITIGRPIDNTNIYILAENDHLQYRGGIGEIAIGGMGVSKGYANNQKLTDEKFISLVEASGKVYKTGDLGKWDKNGNLHCLGRNDYQVKIRGYRVELGEVEELISKHETVQKVAVVDKMIAGNNVLLAFVQTQDYKPVETGVLMDFATEHLPHYMIPYAFIQIEEFPMTPNGKLDRKVLRAKEIAVQAVEEQQEIVPPQNEVEEALYGIWKQILEKDDFGCQQPFFYVGGNSLLLILMLNEVKKKYPVDISVADLYEAKTIEAIGKLIQEKQDSHSMIEQSDFAFDKDVSELKCCELSGAQLRLYLLEQMDPVRCKYNIPSAFIVEGNLDAERLENALNTVISRHEILRTSFEIIDQTPMQKIHDEVHLVIERKEKIQDVDAEIRAFVREFDLECPPLIHALIGIIDESHMLFLFDMHHLVTDGTSAQLFIDEVERVYNGVSLQPVAHQYKEFSLVAKERVQSVAYQKQEAYWKEVFETEYKKVKLPTFGSGNGSTGNLGKNYFFEIEADIYQRMENFAKANDYTVFMILVATLNILIHKYTGSNDITIGTPVSGRNTREEKEMLGVFINTLVLRSMMDEQMSVKEVLDATKKMSLGAFNNADYGFEDLVQQVSVVRDLEQNPLFDIMFVYQIFGEKEVCLEGAKLRKYRIKDIVPKYEISFEMIPDGNKIDCVLEYDANLYSERYMEEFVGQYLQILKEILSNVEQTVKELAIDDREQKQQIIQLGKGEKYPVTETVVDLWYQHLRAKAENSQHIAIVNSGISYTYGELERTSNRIANYLYDNYKDTNMVFGVLIKREYLLIATLLGILKAGGSYIPIDVSYPEDRIQYILENVDAAAYLRTKSTDFQIEGKEKLDVDEVVSTYENETALNRCNFDCVAYTIYTSGSTGKPKGVVIGQRAMSNFVQSIHRIEPFDETSSMLGVTTISFDIFVLECYVTLCYGGKLILANDTEVSDVGELAKLIRDAGVNRIQFTPSRIMMILEIPEYAACLQQVKTVFVGGEALPVDTLNRLRGCTNARLINVYGPTETTVWSTYRDVTKADVVTIGRPLDNTDVYILDKHDQLLFRNGIGELAIGGMGVANGYYNNQELTDERFIYTDFAEGRIYKTGDLARWDDAGNLVCLGRIDHQVKIRGYRVELDEIDSVILSYNEKKKCEIITRAVTIAKNMDGVNELYTFIELNPDYPLEDGNELKKYIETKLPFYMIPKGISFVEGIPFTNNGKIDRKALQKYELEDTATEHGMTVPENKTEEELLEIWSTVLNQTQISCDQKFFEIGGNSLLLIKMLKMIRETFDITLTAGDLFKLQTIRKIAEEIDRLEVKQELFYQGIEVPENFFTQNKRSGLHGMHIKCATSGSETDAYKAYIKLFVKIVSLLNKKDTIGINISTEAEKCMAINLLTTDLDCAENEKAMMDALTEPGTNMSKFINKIQKKHMKVLFAMNQKVKEEVWINTFDVIIQMKVVNGTMHVQIASNNRRINKSAVEYIISKTEALYEQYEKLGK